MKELLVGQNGNKKTVDWFTWLAGTKMRVSKAYVWLNGTKQIFYEKGASVVENFWFYYKTKNNDVVITSPYFSWKKFQNGITFYAMVSNNDYYNYNYWVLVLSTDEYGIQVGVTNYLHEGGTVTRGNDTWYWGICNNMVAKSDNPDPQGCIINPPYSDYNTMKTQGISDLLDRIYANDFAEDYQVGQRYNLVKADKEKTIRKFIAVYLKSNIWFKTGTYANAYNAILQNVETIVRYFLEQSAGYSVISLSADYYATGGLSFYCNLSNDTPTNVLIESYIPDYNDGYSSYETDCDVLYTKWAAIYFKSDGTLGYDSGQWTSDIPVYIGEAGAGSDYLEWNNLGLSYTGEKQHYATHDPNAYIRYITQPLYFSDKAEIYVAYDRIEARKTTIHYTRTHTFENASSPVYSMFLKQWNSNYNAYEYAYFHVSENPFTLHYVVTKDGTVQNDDRTAATTVTYYGKTYYAKALGEAYFTEVVNPNYGYINYVLTYANIDYMECSVCSIFPQQNSTYWEAAYIIFDGEIH